MSLARQEVDVTIVARSRRWSRSDPLRSRSERNGQASIGPRLTAFNRRRCRKRVDFACSSPLVADDGAAPHVPRRRLFRQRLLTGVGSGASEGKHCLLHLASGRSQRRLQSARKSSNGRLPRSTLFAQSRGWQTRRSPRRSTLGPDREGEQPARSSCSRPCASAFNGNR